MARIPNRSRFGLGVVDGYGSDAAYLSATGSSAKCGDLYYNTSSNRYRYYTGSVWTDLTTNSHPTIRLIDRNLVSIPSGAQTIDGIPTNAGDIVILAAYDNKAYQVEAGVWTEYPLFNTQAAPSEGEMAYVKEGSVYADTYIWYDVSSWRILNLSREATITGAIPIWDGNRYIANDDLIGNAASLSTQNDSAADAVQAQSLTISAGNKTAGTGDGGDLYLKGGTSSGGQKGRVRIDAAATQFVNNIALPALPETGDFYFIIHPFVIGMALNGFSLLILQTALRNTQFLIGMEHQNGLKIHRY